MKKIIRHALLGFFIIMLLENCFRTSMNEAETIVKLTPTETKKLELGKVTHLIQLENTENSLLQSIDKTIVDLQNDRIFVLSHLNMYIFSAKGKYISKKPRPLGVVFYFYLKIWLVIGIILVKNITGIIQLP